MLHSDLGTVLDLVKIHTEKLTQSGSSHRAGRTDFRLTAALGTADGGVCLDDIADKTGSGKSFADFCIGEAALFLHIIEDCRKNTAGAAGWGRYDGTAAGILLAYGKGIGADKAVFLGLGGFVDMALIEEELRLTLNIETALKNALGVKAASHSSFHCLPYLTEVSKYLVALNFPYVLGKTEILHFAVTLDVLEVVKLVDVAGSNIGLTLDLNSAAANAENAPEVKLIAIFIVGKKFHCVWMGQVKFLHFVVEKNLYRFWGKGILNDSVSHMTFAGFGQRAKESHLEALCLRVSVLKKL